MQATWLLLSNQMPMTDMSTGFGEKNDIQAETSAFHQLLDKQMPLSKQTNESSLDTNPVDGESFGNQVEDILREFSLLDSESLQDLLDKLEEMPMADPELMEQLTDLNPGVNLLAFLESLSEEKLRWLHEALEQIQGAIVGGENLHAEGTKQKKMERHDVTSELLPYVLEESVDSKQRTRSNPETSSSPTTGVMFHEREITRGEITHQLLTQVEQLLLDVDSAKDLSVVAPKLLKLLEMWHQQVVRGKDAQNGMFLQHLQELNIDGLSQQSLHEANIYGTKKRPLQDVWKIWQELVQRYGQKSNFHSKKIYPLESKVTTNDIIRWLGRALNANFHTEKSVNQSLNASVSMPIAQVEQFVIHLPNATSTQLSDKVLLEQFQRLIDGNKHILFQPRGQLAITLKPENLGEMLIRFTKMNGEMMVKILVTTTVAKEMLEGNMQQLRHMFAPHQVVIERHDANTVVSEPQTPQKEGENEQDNHKDRPTKEQEQQDEKASFAEFFDEWLMNEKV